MAEIKRTFQAGKMNKNLDERIVPNGEYRDALNIEVKTSDDDDAGVVQLLSGNIQRLENSNFGSMNATESWTGEKSCFVGSIANERTNKAYFFIASPKGDDYSPNPSADNGVTATKAYKDMIIEYDTITKTIKPVVVDIFKVHLTQSDLGTVGQGVVSGYDSIVVADATKRALIRPGMRVYAQDTNGVNQLTTDHDYENLNQVIVKSIHGTKVKFDKELHGTLATAVTWTFTADPVLGFHTYSYNDTKTTTTEVSKVVTGINIIEDMLFWTDNKLEPKKVNLTRAMAGTPDFNTHTKLYISNPSSMSGHLVSLDYVDEGTDASLIEEHITVIKRAPRCAPKLEMSLNGREGVTTGNVSNQSFVYGENVVNPENSETLYAIGDAFQIGHVVPNVTISGANYLIGDIIILTAPSGATEPFAVRAKIQGVASNNSYTIGIISASNDITASDTNWSVELEKDKALFELKFGRFGYRYKYQDGEYSSFSPWSELAFLGGAFDYVPTKGYNLGMVNNARQIKITDFIVEDVLRPDDVVAVDILYKDTTSPNCYVVKTIERGRHSEWNDASSGGNSGVLNITSEMIHRTLPSSQILRAWDNVPRVAKAQEVTGNRVVYGNYLQNFDVNQPITLDQGLSIIDHPYPQSPVKSIKSIRKYKIGVVYGDKYGRETPVLGMGGLTVTDTGKGLVVDNLKADVTNPKKNCDKKTKLTVRQNWESGGAKKKSYVPSGWMDYYKYYVKETTNEYYNLVLDRWYNAEDGNVWLSFQSADRNKVDEETYIILKNGHGNQEAILSEARYKIIAIENEAPDFIKTTEKIKGDLEVTADNGNGMSGIPSSMVAKFDSNGWTQVFKGIQFKGIGYARIKGVYGGSIAYSQWVKISRLNHEQFTVTTTEEFGDSADMSVILNTNAEYFLQIKDAVVENRPEFDGRFFVKVQKNSTLATNVMQQTNDDIEYATTHSFKHAYIRNNRYNPATSGPHANTQWSDGGSEFNNGNVDQMGMCGHKPKTRQFWINHGTGGFNNGAKWFLDEARAVSGGYGTRRGLYSRPGISGKSAMDFSVRLSSFPDPQSNAGKFKSLMTTPGTLFRFRNDPLKVVYEVKSEKGGSNWGKNYQRSKTRCNKDCKDSHPSCVRRTFGTFFTRADDPTRGLDVSDFDPRGELKHNGKSHAYIDVVDANYTYADNIRFTEGNAVWETEPKEDVGLDLYYEASNALPVRLTHKYAEQFAPRLAPITVEREDQGSVFIANAPIVHTIVRDVVGIRDKTSSAIYPFRVATGDMLKFHHDDGTVTSSKVVDHYQEIRRYDSSTDDHDLYAPSTTYNITVNLVDRNITATRTDSNSTPGFNTNGANIWEVISTSSSSVTIPKGTFITNISGNTLTLTNGPSATVTGVSCTVKLVTGCYKLDSKAYLYETELGWFNCYSFGNGLESDRIRDDYNAPTIDNGVKVSTTLDKYGEERRGSGMIYSGIFNSTSGVNELNEFNMAESITKDLNPTYGTIQALKSRDTNLVSFCEDKVLKILANKDALFNADGSSNVTASNAVLGDAKAFVGDYGISSNPESLAVDSYRMYFTDKQRGKVLRLSQDGLTPISDVGMTSWFRENLKSTYEVLGTFDEVKGEYNVTLKYPAAGIVTQGYENKTLSFSERGKGWVSFKSFIPETGLSMNGEYITGAVGSSNVSLWSHHNETVNANNFYGTQYTSTIDILFNDNPGIVKGFTNISYTGTQAYIEADLNDNQYYNLANKAGWAVSSIETDKQQGQVKEFIEKEGKWFNYILGQETNASNYLTNLDTSEFSVQGLGTPSSVTGQTAPVTFTLTIEEQGGD